MKRIVFLVSCAVILLLSSAALAQGAGEVKIQPQIGKIAVPLDNLKEILASLKAIEANLSKLSVEIDSLKSKILKLKEAQSEASSSLIQKQSESFKSLESAVENIIPELNKIGEALKSLEKSELTQLSVISDKIKKLEGAIRNIKLPKLDLTPLKREIDSLKKEFLKKSEEEMGFLSREVAEKLKQIKKLDSKLDFLSTVIRRAMVFFKNLEDLEKEAKKFSTQISEIGREIKKLKEVSKEEFKKTQSKEATINGLLTVNLILLVLLVFFELERRFKKRPPMAEKKQNEELEREKEESADEKGEESES